MSTTFAAFAPSSSDLFVSAMTIIENKFGPQFAGMIATQHRHAYRLSESCPCLVEDLYTTLENILSVDTVNQIKDQVEYTSMAAEVNGFMSQDMDRYDLEQALSNACELEHMNAPEQITYDMFMNEY